MLRGKTIVLGVTGGIAAYKAASLASLLVKQHASVEVVMTFHRRFSVSRASCSNSQSSSASASAVV